MILADSAATSGWFALAGVLGGVIVTGAFALLTAFFNHRWQASQASVEETRRAKTEVFQERKQAYAEFIGNSNLIWSELKRLSSEVRTNGPRPDPPELSELLAKSEALRAEISLLASEPVVSAVNKYEDEQVGARVAARQGQQPLPDIYPAYVSAMKAMREEVDRGHS